MQSFLIKWPQTDKDNAIFEKLLIKYFFISET